MDANTLIRVYKEYTAEINSKKVKELLDFNNKLYSHSVVNRVLITEQTRGRKEIYDLRTKEEWYSIGRKVIDSSDIVYILNPVKATVYKDKKTGESITSDELSNEEIKMAVNLGMITKDEEVCFMEVLKVYDISNTKQSITSEYSRLKPLGFKEITSIIERLYNLKFTTKPNSEGIYVGNISVDEVIVKIASEVADKCDINKSNFIYTVSTMYGIQDESTIEHCTIEDISNIYEVMQSILEESYSNKERQLYNCKVDRRDIERAKKMLKVLEATNIYIDVCR